jgi:hypothetical protein
MVYRTVVGSASASPLHRERVAEPLGSDGCGLTKPVDRQEALSVGEGVAARRRVWLKLVYSSSAER